MKLYNQLKKYIEKAFSAPEKNIYHYTNVRNEIIESRFLKLSSHDFLNNKGNKELETSRDLIIACMEKRELPIMNFREYLDKGIKIYTVSFCEEENYDYAMKKYGKECICFKNKFLNTIKSTDNHLILSKVKYNPIEQKQIINKIFKFYDKSKEDNKFKTLLLWLSIVIPLFKRNEDRHDKESRIVTAEIFSPENGKLITESCPKKVDFNLNETIVKNI